MSNNNIPKPPSFIEAALAAAQAQQQPKLDLIAALPPGLIPQEVPLAVSIAAAQTAHGPRLVLQVASPTGVSLYVFKPDVAKALGEAIVDAARAAIIGLVQQ